MSERNFCQWQQHAWHQSLLTAKEGNSITTTLLVKGSLYQALLLSTNEILLSSFPPRYSLMREIWGTTQQVFLFPLVNLCKAELTMKISRQLVLL